MIASGTGMAVLLAAGCASANAGPPTARAVARPASQRPFPERLASPSPQQGAYPEVLGHGVRAARPARCAVQLAPGLPGAAAPAARDPHALHRLRSRGARGRAHRQRQRRQEGHQGLRPALPREVPDQADETGRRLPRQRPEIHGGGQHLGLQLPPRRRAGAAAVVDARLRAGHRRQHRPEPVRRGGGRRPAEGRRRLPEPVRHPPRDGLPGRRAGEGIHSDRLGLGGNWSGSPDYQHFSSNGR